jgi:hypothetical protein
MSVEGIRSVLEANRQLLHQALPSFRRSLEKCRSLELAENLNKVYRDCMDLSERLLLAIHSADPAVDRISGKNRR